MHKMKSRQLSEVWKGSGKNMTPSRTVGCTSW